MDNHPNNYGNNLAANRKVGIVEQWLTILALFFSTGAVLTLAARISRDSVTNVAETDPLQQFVWAIIYVMVSVFIARNLPDYIDAAKRNILLLALTGCALLSPLWSVDPSYSFMRAIALSGTMLFGVYLGTRYSPQGLLHVLAVAFFLLGATSILTAVLLPSFGVEEGLHQGSWRGVLAHKNALGRVAALGVVLFFVCLRSRDCQFYRRGFYVLGFVLMIICTLGSQSRTSWALAALGIAAYFPVQLYAMRRAWLSLLVTMGIIVTGTMLFFGVFDFIFESTLAAMDRDVTLTGRTLIWQYVWDALDNHFWLGYGQAAFWVSPLGALTIRWPLGGWMPPHAHNGLLELWLGLGFVGVALFVVSFIRTFIKAAASLSPQSNTTLFPLIYLVVFAVADFTEISIMRHNNIYWVLYVALVVSLSLSAKPKPLNC